MSRHVGGLVLRRRFRGCLIRGINWGNDWMGGIDGGGERWWFLPFCSIGPFMYSIIMRLMSLSGPRRIATALLGDNARLMHGSPGGNANPACIIFMTTFLFVLWSRSWLRLYLQSIG